MKKQNSKNFFKMLNRRRVRYGAASVVLSVLFVVAIILVNVFAGIMTNRFSINVDMTRERFLSISDEAKKVTSGLENDYVLYVVSKEDNMRSLTLGNEIVEVLNRFRTAGLGGGRERVEVVYIDPLRNPDFIKSYKTSTQISEYSVIVEKKNSDPKEFKVIPLVDIYYFYDSTQQQIVGLSLERRVASAFLALESPQMTLPLALISVGKGEVEFAGIVEVLAESRYNVQSIDISTQDIPEDTELLVISSPSVDFSADEIEKLEKYLARYKSLVVSMGSSDSQYLPEFEQFLKEWGIQFERSSIYDPKGSQGTRFDSIFSRRSSSDSEFLSGVTASGNILSPMSRPITRLWEKRTVSGVTRNTVSLLKSLNGSYTKPFSPDGAPVVSVEYDAGNGDVYGPFDTAVYTYQETIINNVAVEGGVLFLSSPYMYNKNILSQGAYSNMQFATNVAAQFSGTAVSVNIKSKSFISPSLDVIGAATDRVFILLIAVPLALIVTGTVVFIRRKNR